MNSPEGLKGRPPTRPPYDDKFAYSNVGYSLLGGLIEQVTRVIHGPSYLQRNIVDPLGMTETHPLPRKATIPCWRPAIHRLSDNYERKPMPFFLMNGFEASANFASTIERSGEIRCRFTLS